MKRTLLFVAGTTLLASTAMANPYATEVLRARLVTGPHVQLTYGKSSSYFPMKDPSTPTQVNTYGATKTAWRSEPTYFNTKTGSGVVSLRSLQMCDCNVPDGQVLSYTISVPSLQTEGQTTKLSATTAGRAAPSMRLPDGGLYPWDIPDPTDLQGLDCSKACAEAQPGVDAAAPDARGVRRGDGESERDGHGGVDGVASLLQDLEAGAGRGGVRRRDHPVLGRGVARPRRERRRAGEGEARGKSGACAARDVPPSAAAGGTGTARAKVVRSERRVLQHDLRG